MRVIILSHHSPSSLKQPLIRDSSSKALLSAMSKLSEKTGNKVFVFNNKSWLDHFSAAGQGGVGVDWALVQTHTAPLSKQAIKNAIKQWGSNKWQLRWAKLAACQQTKVWFPAIKNVPAHFVRRLNRYDLSRVWEYCIEYWPDTLSRYIFCIFSLYLGTMYLYRKSVYRNASPIRYFFYFTLHAFSTTVKGKGFNYLSVYKSW